MKIDLKIKILNLNIFSLYLNLLHELGVTDKQNIKNIFSKSINGKLELLIILQKVILIMYNDLSKENLYPNKGDIIFYRKKGFREEIYHASIYIGDDKEIETFDSPVSINKLSSLLEYIKKNIMIIIIFVLLLLIKLL